MSEMAELDGERDLWSLMVTKAENGFLLTYKDHSGINHIVVEDEPDGVDSKTTQKLLNEVMEHFNLFGSRYDEERVSVVIVKGDKYEQKSKKTSK